MQILKFKFKYRLSLFYNSMKLYGYGMLHPNDTKPESRLYNCYTWSLFAIMIIEACATVSGTALEVDLNVKIYGIAINCTHFLFLLKYWTVVMNRDKVKSIINVIERKCHEFTEEKRFGDDATKEMYRVIRNYGAMANVSILGYVVVTFNRRLSGSGSTTKGWQLVPMYIPFDFQFTEDGPYVIQSLITMFILLNGYYHIVMDTLMSTIFIHIGAQFTTVAHCFSAVKYDDNKTKNENEDLAQKQLIKAIEYHQIVLGCAADLQLTLKYWFMAQIIESTVPLCLTLWLVLTSVGSESVSFLDLTSHFMFMSFLLYQLYILMRGPDIVTSQALGVVDGVWHSDWYRFSPTTRRIAYQVLIRATNPVRFSALGIVGVNINTFIEVVKNAYAFFTLLKNSNVAAHPLKN